MLRDKITLKVYHLRLKLWYFRAKIRHARFMSTFICWHFWRRGAWTHGRRCISCFLKHEMWVALIKEQDKQILYGDGTEPTQLTGIIAHDPMGPEKFDLPNGGWGCPHFDKETRELKRHPWDQDEEK